MRVVGSDVGCAVGCRVGLFVGASNEKAKQVTVVSLEVRYIS